MLLNFLLEGCANIQLTSRWIVSQYACPHPQVRWELITPYYVSFSLHVNNTFAVDKLDKLLVQIQPRNGGLNIDYTINIHLFPTCETNPCFLDGCYMNFLGHSPQVGGPSHNDLTPNLMQVWLGHLNRLKCMSRAMYSFSGDLLDTNVCELLRINILCTRYHEYIKY